MNAAKGKLDPIRAMVSSSSNLPLPYIYMHEQSYKPRAQTFTPEKKVRKNSKVNESRKIIWEKQHPSWWTFEYDTYIIMSVQQVIIFLRNYLI